MREADTAQLETLIRILNVLGGDVVMGNQSMENDMAMAEEK